VRLASLPGWTGPGLNLQGMGESCAPFCVVGNSSIWQPSVQSGAGAADWLWDGGYARFTGEVIADSPGGGLARFARINPLIGRRQAVIDYSRHDRAFSDEDSQHGDRPLCGWKRDAGTLIRSVEGAAEIRRGFG